MLNLRVVDTLICNISALNQAEILGCCSGANMSLQYRKQDHSIVTTIEVILCYQRSFTKCFLKHPEVSTIVHDTLKIIKFELFALPENPTLLTT